MKIERDATGKTEEESKAARKRASPKDKTGMNR
jgi:hypothetical protein